MIILVYMLSLTFATHQIHNNTMDPKSVLLNIKFQKKKYHQWKRIYTLITKSNDFNYIIEKYSVLFYHVYVIFMHH